MKPLVLAGVAAILAAAGMNVPNLPSPSPSSPGCGRDEAEYVGADSCKKCHFAQHSSWKKTTMAKAFETLKPGQAAEMKQKFGLDPAKDYSKDASCVPCHVTGYGKPGGYPAICEGQTWSEEETTRAKKMEGVQCESCHGPGSLTSAHKKDHEDYKRADLLAMGMILPDAESCKACHNEKSPTVPKDVPFDYAAATKEADKIHKHIPLKNKHE